MHSKNKIIEQIELTKDRLYDRYGKGGSYLLSSTVAVNQGNVYYVSADGVVSTAPLNSVHNVTAIHQLGAWIHSDDLKYNPHYFYEENGQLILHEHFGDDAVVSDYRYMITQNGIIKLKAGDCNTTIIEGERYTILDGPMAQAGNLSVIHNSDIKGKSTALGQSDYWYIPLSQTMGLPNLVKKDNALFVKAAKRLDDNQDEVYEKTAVYAVDVVTDQMTKINLAEGAVNSVRIVDDVLYYAAQDKVFKHNLVDGTEQMMGEMYYYGNALDSVIFMAHAIYYIRDYDHGNELCDLKSGKLINPGAAVIDFNITGDNGNYTAIRFEETSSSKYRMMLFDNLGNCVFKTADSVSNVTVEADFLYYYNLVTETIFKINLK